MRVVVADTMTSGEDWQSDIKEEGDNESMLVDVESHEDLPNMKTETEDSFLDQVRTSTFQLFYSQ